MTQVTQLKQLLEDRQQELLNVKLELIENKIARLQEADADKETRMRSVESSRTRFEMLAWLAFGGGAVSAVNLILRIAGN